MKNDAKASDTNVRPVLETLQDSIEGNESDGQEKSAERENETLQGAGGNKPQEIDGELQADNEAKLTFDEALKRYGFQGEFDRRVNRAIQEALGRKRREWEEESKVRNKPSKAEKLEAEIEEMKKSLVLEKNMGDARTICAESNAVLPQELLKYVVCEDSEKTISSTLGLIQCYKDTVAKAVKAKLRGPVPKASIGTVNTWTKEKIMNVKDREKRLKLIAENPELFVKRRRF